jgi:hypothetical protein
MGSGGEGGKLIPKNSLDEMLTGRIATGDFGPHYGYGSPQYGFGWMVSDELGHKEIWPHGTIEGFTSLNIWYPDDDAYIVVLDNANSPVLAISHALAAILFGQKYEIPEEHKATILLAGELLKYVGHYQLKPHSMPRSASRKVLTAK